ncbi:MAG TPA: cytochrome c maturation protein CcmE [Devosiaceae bacterium]
MTRKQKKLTVILGLLAVVALAVALILSALRNEIVFFYTPSEMAAQHVAVGQAVRIGGLVGSGSCKKQGEKLDFIVGDGKADIKVSYTGIVPDLFREGQGVVAEGSLLPDGTFKATTILAKHDENYMPKNVVDKLKENGEWERAPTAAAPGEVNPCR